MNYCLEVYTDQWPKLINVFFFRKFDKYWFCVKQIYWSECTWINKEFSRTSRNIEVNDFRNSKKNRQKHKEWNLWFRSVWVGTKLKQTMFYSSTNNSYTHLYIHHKTASAAHAPKKRKNKNTQMSKTKILLKRRWNKNTNNRNYNYNNKTLNIKNKR